MKPRKIDHLNTIIVKLVNTINERCTKKLCGLTERGLIVAGKSDDGLSPQTLAAMMALLSDVAIRINDTLGYGLHETVSIKTPKT